MTSRTFLILAGILLAGFLPISLTAQTQPGGGSITAPVEGIEELQARAGTALEEARKESQDILSPHHFERALALFEEGRSAVASKREETLIRIKFKQSLEELDEAKKVAEAARAQLGGVLAARQAAVAAGADSVGEGNWRRSEERFRSLVREFERSSTSAKEADVEEIAAMYRAARRDALRNLILKDAKERISEVERRDGTRLFPTVLLRAQQAMSRAEAELAQDNLDGARTDAKSALHHANHALALITYADGAQKEKHPWESALVPYDDMLDKVLGQLNSEYDYAQSGAFAGPKIDSLISARQDTLIAQAAHDSATIKSLEESLAEAQTHLTDTQNRIAEMQRRLETVQGSKDTAQAQLEKGKETIDRIGRAQSLFKPGEAVILQNDKGDVIVRLQAIRFAEGETNLTKTHLKVLDKAAEAIALFPGAAISVEGHTDSLGDADQNLALSEKRAAGVADYLAAKMQIARDQIKSAGFGAARPIATNATPEGRGRNRRIDIVLTYPK
jgi:OmpA-OmpF porin, OOP family